MIFGQKVKTLKFSYRVLRSNWRSLAAYIKKEKARDTNGKHITKKTS